MAEPRRRRGGHWSVVSAQDRLHEAYGVQGIGTVKGYFHMPVGPFATAPGEVAHVSGMRNKLRLMMDMVTEVAQNLDSAAVYMEAAEILALRGSNLSGPEWPFLSAQLLGPQEAALGTALGRLRTSRDMAEAASTYARWCSGHLSMTTALLDYLGILPSATNLLDREAHTAYLAIDVASRRTEDALRDVTGALEFLTPP